MVPQDFKAYEVIILEWLKRFLLPDFTNKLTWVIALAGISMVALPHALIVAAINWLIALSNANQWVNAQLQLLPYDEQPMGYWLIAGALAHNIINKVVTLRLGSLQHEIAREKRLLDVKLLEDFIALLPSNGATADLLRDHDFAGIIRSAGIPAIETFVYEWDNAEHQFLSPQLEGKKKSLLALARDFLIKLATYTIPKGKGFLTVYPANIDPEVFVPDYLKMQISELNQAAATLYEAHQAFIRYARENL